MSGSDPCPQCGRSFDNQVGYLCVRCGHHHSALWRREHADPIRAAAMTEEQIMAEYREMGEEPLIVFVAGPYTAADDAGIGENVAAACAAGKALLEKGHWPFIPHLTMTYDCWHENTYGERAPADLYYDWDLAMLERCHGLLYLAPSPGADREMKRAIGLGLPVWTSVGEVPGG